MKLRNTQFWAVALTIAFSAVVFAQQPTPRSMAAVGDSITAGALANFSRTDGLNPFFLPKFLYHIGKMGFMRSLRGMEARGRSWSTGTGSKVGTHVRYFQYLNGGRKLDVYNAAVSGAASADIYQQVNSILQWSESLGEGAPDYVTVEIGANDACNRSNDQMTSAAAYTNHLREAVTRLLQADPDTKIMIAGVPNLEHLRDMAKDAWVSGVPPAARCKNMWAIHKFCNNMLLESDPAQRRAVTERINAYMAGAEAVMNEANATFGSDRVRFSRAVNDYKFNDKEISIDCFHPNWRGQQALSNVIWLDSWWADLDQ